LVKKNPEVELTSGRTKTKKVPFYSDFGPC
jgi:hypothetical protein